jgi:hydroxymethylbilane synthase
MDITVGSRGSRLSRAQVAEVLAEIRKHRPDIQFTSHYITTSGDLNLKQSLRDLDKTDFFTKEIDQLQVDGAFRISIHSAKDLPEPLHPGLELVALTRGVDNADVLVTDHDPLPYGAKIGTSSHRRDETIRELRSDLQPKDIRGTIDQRLALVDSGQFDGVVMAEAALIRLQLTHRKRIFLKCTPAAWQGKLAIIARKGDREMQELFGLIHDKDALSRH